MDIEKQFQSDVDKILARRYDNGADYWTTPDKRLCKGSPYSALNCAFMLLELGMEPSDPLMMKIADLFLSSWREDGRFKLSPQGSIYPCNTINAANVLCHLGYASDQRLQKTFYYLLKIA